MKPGNRLQLISSMIPETSLLVCDIGTDHCFLPIYLILNNICDKVIATDNKSEPLKKALKNVTKYNLTERIILIEGYGLEVLNYYQPDVIVIAGMGGKLIRDILSKDTINAKRARLILQPMNAAEVLREWLYINGFEISEEVLVKEGIKIYIVIVASWTGKIEKPDDFYFYFSKPLLQNPNPLLIEYLKKNRVEMKNILDGKKNSKRDTISSQILLSKMINKLDFYISSKGDLKEDDGKI